MESPLKQLKELQSIVRNPRKYREANSLRQEEFWGRIGVTQSSGSRYEANGIPPHIGALLLLLESGAVTQDKMDEVLAIAGHLG